VVFAVNVEEVATPFVPVTSVSVLVPLAKVPLGPDAGAVNVTASPLVAIELEVTVALNGVENVFPTAPLCADPLVAVMPTTSAIVGVELGADEVELPLLLHAVESAAARQIKPTPPARRFRLAPDAARAVNLHAQDLASHDLIAQPPA
jgi:hypothetical protein